MSDLSIGPPGEGEIPPRILGEAGASAGRIHRQRRDNRERRVRERHPLIGGAMLALGKEPVHERNWGTGAEGERVVAASLEKRCGDDVFLRHDRRMPGSRANIDHLAITCNGVWVIDAKRYRGKVKVERSLLRKGQLRINGRDRTHLLDGLDRQVAAVSEALALVAGDVEVKGALCFVDVNLPMFRPLKLRGYPLLMPRQLSTRLNADGRLQRERIELLTEQLTERFPAA